MRHLKDFSEWYEMDFDERSFVITNAGEKIAVGDRIRPKERKNWPGWGDSYAGEVVTRIIKVTTEDEPRVYHGEQYAPASWYERVPANASKPSAGRKFDANKPRPELLPPYAEEEVSRVLAFGAEKYDDDNWRLVENAKKRYLGAARRHIIAYRRGETHDPESNLHPLAHAICSLMFILELELEKSK